MLHSIIHINIPNSSKASCRDERVAQPSVGVAQPCVGLAQPSVGVAKPGVGVAQLCLGVAQPKIKDKKLSGGDPAGFMHGPACYMVGGT